MVVNNPEEQCHMEPQRVCKQITKLVPGLKPRTECVFVPQEVCAMSKINPTKVQRPRIQKWCYDPQDIPTEELPEDPSDEQPTVEPTEEPTEEPTTTTTEPECTVPGDCSDGETCERGYCTSNPGKVLLTEFNIYTRCGSDCGSQDQLVEVKLVGQKQLNENDEEIDNSCSFNNTVGLLSEDGSDRIRFGDQRALKDCWKHPLNARIRTGGRSFFSITADASLGVHKVCADWIDPTTPTLVCDAELVSLVRNIGVYNLNNCEEEMSKCPATL